MGLTSQLSNLGTQISSGNITNSLGAITTLAQQYIVAPLAAFGMGGLVFNAEGESIALLSADITDHYTELNLAVQDHIAIKPKRVTLKGYVGELVYSAPGNNPSVINSLAQKLTTISAYLPALTNGAQQAQSLFTSASNGTATLESALTSTSNIYGLVQNVLGAFGNTKNQQNAYTYFKSLMQSGTLMGIQTPWEFMTNMAIESIAAYQDEKSKYITEFSVSFKEIRIASTQTLNAPSSNTGTSVPTSPVAQGATALQTADTTNQGANAGASLPFNLLPGAQATMTGVSNFLSNPSLKSFFSAQGATS